MVKIKTFRGCAEQDEDAQKLEETVQTWLDENPNVQIVSSNVAANAYYSNGVFLYIILYEIADVEKQPDTTEQAEE